jgi:hypothetical protein
VIPVRNMQLVLPKIYHASCYPRSGLVQIAKSLVERSGLMQEHLIARFLYTWTCLCLQGRVTIDSHEQYP